MKTLAIITSFLIAGLVAVEGDAFPASSTRQPVTDRPASITSITSYTIDRFPVQIDESLCAGTCDPGYYVWLTFNRPRHDTHEALWWSSGRVARSRLAVPGEQTISVPLTIRCYREEEGGPIIPGNFIGAVRVIGSDWELKFDEWTDWYVRGISPELCEGMTIYVKEEKDGTE